MQIALFGGSFDPPHQGHQFITQQLIDQHIVDSVWFVPVKNHPFFRQITPVEQRVEMLELVVKDLKQDLIRIERYEIDHPGMSYSFDTLSALSQKYPQDSFSWIIGSDNIANFPRWHDADQLLKNFPVYVYPRQGFAPQPLLPGMIFLQKLPEITVSATEIRQKVEMNQDISSLVTPAVAKYIFDHQLYHPQV